MATKLLNKNSLNLSDKEIKSVKITSLYIISMIKMRLLKTKKGPNHEN